MDDLDHSMHIAEFDWSRFCDESEACSLLLQPTLAWPDILSDSEDLENSSLVFSAGQQETGQSPEVNSDITESNSAGCSASEESCTMSQMNLNESGAEKEEVTSVTQAEPDCRAGNIISTTEVGLKSAEDITEDTSDNTTRTLQSEILCLQCTGASTALKKEDEDVQTDTQSSHELTPLSVIGPDSADRAVSEDVRAEKERWFVTMNYSPARPRARAPSVKKKRRQKKPCKISHTRCYRQEGSLGEDTEGGRDMEGFTESSQDLIQNSGGHQSAETDPESVSDMLQESCEEDNVSENQFHPPKENFSEATMGKNKPKPGGSASTSQDTSTHKAPSQAESAESDEFSSIHSYDSECYLSAAESAEEAQHLLVEKLQPVDSVQLQYSVSDSTQMHSFQSTLSCNVAAANCDCYECTDVDPALTFPSAGQRANKTPDDNSTCDTNTHGTDTPGVQKDKSNLSASGSSSGDQRSPVPDLTVTPCSVFDSPETYAEAAGHTRPVFAISAFWDEMEKLTINDILQLRMSRSPVTANVDESLTGHGSPVDTVQYNLSDGGVVELSDTADSDYFTQPDESKPDRSSCEFYTSDFEEEYWQFIGASRNPSPDPRDSPFLSPEEEQEAESTSSEGKVTPVPLDDFAGQCFENQGSHTLSELTWPTGMTKSKSMRDVQALNINDSTFPFGKDESRCQTVEETMALKVSDSLETLTSALFLSSSDTDELDECFPEVFEYFFTEDKAKNDSWCITVYNPQDLFSVVPVLDYTLCTLRDDFPFSSLHDSLCSEDKPIPIFSCCPPTIREITFPKPDYVFLRTEEDTDNFSPFKVMSRSFFQADQCGTLPAVPGGFHSWKSLLSMRKIRFHDKGSVWCTTSGTCVFLLDAEKAEGKDPPITVLTEGKVSATSQLFRELAAQRSILETKGTARREGIFSTLKQSDMCLVCIAFASWVMRSSDPENADAWKAALLANVSALSAIQYLRHYVKKKKRPPQDDP